LIVLKNIVHKMHLILIEKLSIKIKLNVKILKKNRISQKEIEVDQKYLIIIILRVQLKIVLKIKVFNNISNN
jgi:hypothetical protein